MVLFVLCVKGELEGVGSMVLRNDAELCISVKNPLSDYEVRERVTLRLSEHVEQEDENSREPPCHFALKWDGAKKRSTLTVLTEAEAKAATKKKSGKGKIAVNMPRELNSDDSGEWVPVLALECRGLEPYAFHPLSDEFLITSQGGVKFQEGVDLSEGDWGDYDAENDSAVSISDFQSKFITA